MLNNAATVLCFDTVTRRYIYLYIPPAFEF